MTCGKDMQDGVVYGPHSTVGEYSIDNAILHMAGPEERAEGGFEGELVFLGPRGEGNGAKEVGVGMLGRVDVKGTIPLKLMLILQPDQALLDTRDEKELDRCQTENVY